MDVHSQNKRLIGVLILAGVLLTLLLLYPLLVRAIERNRLALALIPLVKEIEWANPERVCANLAPPSITSDACDGARECYLGGIHALRAGEWDRVASFVRADPEPLAVLLRGWGAWCGGSHQAAVAEWQRAADPLGNTFLKTGELRFREGKVSSALQPGLLANAISPSGHSHLLLAQIYEQQGDISNALVELRAAIELADSDGGLFYLISDVEWRIKDARAARTHIERALELKIDTFWIWHRYGQILMEADEPAAAETAFMRAVELNPTYGFSNAGVMLARLKQGHVDEALEPLMAAVTFLDSDEHKAGYFGEYAASLAQQGRFARAAEFYQRALEFDPEHPGFWGGLLNAHANAGNCAELEQAYSERTKQLAAQNKTPAPPPPCKESQ